MRGAGVDPTRMECAAQGLSAYCTQSLETGLFAPWHVDVLLWVATLWLQLSATTRAVLIAVGIALTVAGVLLSLLLFIWTYGLIEEKMCYPNWRAAYSTDFHVPVRKSSSVNGAREGTKSGLKAGQV